eukprot:3483729-Rhodomonas_salina.1
MICGDEPSLGVFLLVRYGEYGRSLWTSAKTRKRKRKRFWTAGLCDAGAEYDAGHDWVVAFGSFPDAVEPCLMFHSARDFGLFSQT